MTTTMNRSNFTLGFIFTITKPGDPYARRFMARDPDGHAVMLVQRSQPGETCP